jgi:hypothetical protein
LRNREVYEEFDVNNYYIGPVSICPPPYFHIVVDCHANYMFILHPEVETYAKLVWLARALSKPNFTTFSPHFQRIQVEYYRPPGEITPSYILHTRAFGTYLLGGLFTLHKRL